MTWSAALATTTYPPRLPLRVVKLGGSLLDWPLWPRAYDGWLKPQTPAHTVLIVGGGSWGDAVRQWDAQFELGDDYCHQLCGRLLTLTAELVLKILTGPAMGLPTGLSETRLVADVADLETRIQNSVDAAGTLSILDAGRYLLETCPLDAEPLPCDWSVTSDSIAAHLARRLDADELVLLKSCAPRQIAGGENCGPEYLVPCEEWPELASSGQVDAHFPRIATYLRRVRWIDLRSVRP